MRIPGSSRNLIRPTRLAGESELIGSGVFKSRYRHKVVFLLALQKELASRCTQGQEGSLCLLPDVSTLPRLDKLENFSFHSPPSLLARHWLNQVDLLDTFSSQGEQKRVRPAWKTSKLFQKEVQYYTINGSSQTWVFPSLLAYCWEGNKWQRRNTYVLHTTKARKKT